MFDHSGAVLLLRHGQSEWNAVRRWQGLADIALTDLGREQADAAGAALRTALHDLPPAVGVWSSHLRRAHETATIVAAHVLADASAGSDVIVDARWCEADAGPWQGSTPDEIELAWPGYLASHRRPEGFEPAEAVVERAMAACHDVLDAIAGRGPAVAVTHSGLIRVLRRHLGVNDHRVPNLGGTWIARDAAGSLVAGPVFGPTKPPPGVPAATADDAAEDPGDEHPSSVPHRSR